MKSQCSFKNLGMGIYSYAKVISPKAAIQKYQFELKLIEVLSIIGWTAIALFYIYIESLYLIGVAVARTFGIPGYNGDFSYLFNPFNQHSSELAVLGAVPVVALVIIAIAICKARILVIHLCKRGQDEILARDQAQQ